MEIQLIYNNEEAQKKESLIERINGLMEISCHGLCILFATEDNNNKPYWKVDYDKHYSDQGFYINLEIENGIIPNPWPDEINCILNILGQSKHFIWISKATCESEDIHFAWVYSHEIQHLKQSLNNPYLLMLAMLLDYVKYDVPEIDIPTEFDCERMAKQIVISIFGEDKCNTYLKKMKVRGAANDKRYSKLLKLNIALDFDVEQKLQQAICKNMMCLKDVQKQMQDNGSTNWNINIDKLCSRRNPHNAIVSAVTKMTSNSSSTC